ncbi:MAG: hypothetical protein MJ065_03610 [Oscillospiraceae bacterium]|nr:hypothetical protein [Oscillospiraceae bacterium]
MKRLKFRNPFGGHSWPVIIAGSALVIALPLALIPDIPAGIKFLMFLIPPAALIIGWLAFQRLSAGEREIVESLSYPLWEPVTPEIKSAVTEKMSSTQYSLTGAFAVSIGAFLLFFLMPFMSSRKSYSHTDSVMRDPKFALAAGCIGAVVVFVIIMFTKGIGAFWLSIDDSAVFTKVPIDHMYDIKNHGRYGRVWYTSYLVFYQPDGRYTLRAPKDSGSCNTVVIVKFRNRITWYTAYEQHPEDYLS